MAIIAVSFLQVWTLLGHAAASTEQEPMMPLSLVPMTPPAHWLLSVLEELEPAMSCFTEAWAEVGREALGLMRHWERHPPSDFFRPVKVDQFYARCSVLRTHVLGLSWH